MVLSKVSNFSETLRQLVETDLLLIITLRFSCGEKKVCWNIKRSQNFMKIILGWGYLLNVQISLTRQYHFLGRSNRWYTTLSQEKLVEFQGPNLLLFQILLDTARKLWRTPSPLPYTFAGSPWLQLLHKADVLINFQQVSQLVAWKCSVKTCSMKFCKIHTKTFALESLIWKLGSPT